MYKAHNVSRAESNKKAVLSPRWPRDAPYNCIHGGPEKCQESLAPPTATFPGIVNGLLL